MKNNLLVLRENDSSHCIRIFINLLIIFLILIFTAYSVSASDENDIWKIYKSSQKLYKGDTYPVNDYKIEAYNFPNLDKGYITNPGIGLKIYKNDNPNPIKEMHLTLHESEIYEDIRITAIDLPSGQVIEWQDDKYTPWGKIKVEIKRRPKFDIGISTDEEEYQQNSIITVNIIVRNIGDGDAKNVKLEYDTGGLEVDSTNIDKSRTQFTRRDSITGKLNLKTPETIDKKETYTISVTITGKDLEGEELLPETKSVSIDVLPDSGFISVYSTPSGAKISIDGTYKEITPRTVPVSVGYHTIKLTKSGYKDYTAENIHVSAGETEPISASLARVVPTVQPTPTVPKTGYVSVSSTPSNGKTVVESESLAPITTLKSTPGILDTIGRNWMLIIVSILIIIAGKKVLIEIRLKEYKTTKNELIQMNNILLKHLSGVIDENAFDELENMKSAIGEDNISEAKLHYNKVINYINKNY
jgi:hypothetical protein